MFMLSSLDREQYIINIKLIISISCIQVSGKYFQFQWFTLNRYNLSSVGNNLMHVGRPGYTWIIEHAAVTSFLSRAMKFSSLLLVTKLLPPIEELLAQLAFRVIKRIQGCHVDAPANVSTVKRLLGHQESIFFDFTQILRRCVVIIILRRRAFHLSMFDLKSAP